MAWWMPTAVYTRSIISTSRAARCSPPAAMRTRPSPWSRWRYAWPTPCAAVSVNFRHDLTRRCRWEICARGMAPRPGTHGLDRPGSHPDAAALMMRLGGAFGAAPALESPRRVAELCAAGGALQSICALGSRRRGCAAAMSLHCSCPIAPSIWPCGSASPRIGVTVALANTHLLGEPLAHCHSHCSAAVHHCGCRAAPTRSPRSRSRLPAGPALLGPRVRCAGYRAACGRACAPVERCTVTRPNLRRRRSMRPRCTSTPPAPPGLPKAASGQSLPPDAVEPMVCRHAGHAARRTGCTTACRCTTASAAWWPPARRWWAAARSSSARASRHRISGAMSRDRALHAVPIHRRAVPLPGECAAAVRSRPQHSLRIACGNGLRPEVWEVFQSRFRIPRILEYYASTEGNFSLYNCEGRAGSDRPHPAFLSHRLPVALLRFDLDRGEPRRNAAGFCERLRHRRSGRGGRLDSGRWAERAGRFEGYADSRGDRAQGPAQRVQAGRCLVPHRRSDASRCARLLLFCGSGRRYLRWKGENVSTAEVLTASPARPASGRAVVYGVSVPRTEGRAGMAALVVDAGFDLAALSCASGASACPPTRGRCSCACCRRSKPPAPSSRKNRI